MTHDELLTMIEDKFNNHSGIHDAQIVNSLYRVVELHKPNLKGGCDICSWIINGFVLYEVCPTIQAIKKELA
jgi:hypothetical protein